MIREHIQQMAEEAGIELILADGFDPAFLGWLPEDSPRAIYGIEACIDILVGQGMSEDEAIEFFEFNTLGSCVGPGMPAFIYQQ